VNFGPGLDWHEPIVVAFVAAVLIVALWRRWSIVLLAALVVAVGQGLDYLLRHASLDPALARNAVTGLYLVGAAFLVFLVAARLLSKR
jgi:hypothetical protein